MGWLSGYSKRKPIFITGGASGAQTDFQLKLAAAYAAAMQGDFDDLRFTQADGATLVDAWLESKVDDTSAVVWVEFPTTPANTVEQTYYMYYGNSGAASDWDIGATFLFGDDFPGSSLDTNIWDTTNIGDMVTTVSGGELRCQCSLASGKIYSKAKQYGSPIATRFRWKGWPTAHGYIEAGFKNTDASPDEAVWVAREDSAQWRTDTRNENVCTNTVEGTTGSGTYQNWDILWKSGSEVEYFRADASQRVTTTNVPDESNLHFMIVQGKQDAPGDAYFDWILVRKYAANPPTYEFGSEESTGHPTMRRWGGIPGMQYTGRRSW